MIFKSIEIRTPITVIIIIIIIIIIITLLSYIFNLLQLHGDLKAKLLPVGCWPKSR